MATATAMAALRAMALGDCGGSSSNDDSFCDSGGKDDDNGGNDVGDIRLCCLAIAHFVAHHILATAVTHFVATAIAFVSMQQSGQW